MSTLYAIGDIHGNDALLERLYQRIEHDPHRTTRSRPTVVHLGDYIDRGPDSDKVIDRIMRGTPAFETIALLGNHEQLMLDCLESDAGDVWWPWLTNGGDETLRSLRLSPALHSHDCRALREALGETRIDWLRGLALQYVSEPYLFVHAGILPGRSLEQQETKDLLWIRSRFLESDADHGYVVVHGHSQTVEPEVRKNRIGIDTGRAEPKTLTAAALEGGLPPRFIAVSQEF